MTSSPLTLGESVKSAWMKSRALGGITTTTRRGSACNIAARVRIATTDGTSFIRGMIWGRVRTTQSSSPRIPVAGPLSQCPLRLSVIHGFDHCLIGSLSGRAAGMKRTMTLRRLWATMIMTLERTLWRWKRLGREQRCRSRQLCPQTFPQPGSLSRGLSIGISVMLRPVRTRSSVRKSGCARSTLSKGSTNLMIPRVS